MQQIEVFADVGCPFTHVGLRSFAALRSERSTAVPVLRVRAWSLELVNGEPLTGQFLAPEIDALRAGPAPSLFAGFSAQAFPATTRSAMASAAAAYRVGLEQGEAFSLAVRDALFEQGLDIADPTVLDRLRADIGVPAPSEGDDASIEADLEEGRARGVIGSPHFFTSGGDFFCPSLDIEKDEGGMRVAFDQDGFRRFVDAAFA
ncbi:MAG: DsbA family oxidoreductase [Microthrixaceae bacterium]